MAASGGHCALMLELYWGGWKVVKNFSWAGPELCMEIPATAPGWLRRWGPHNLFRTRAATWNDSTARRYQTRPVTSATKSFGGGWVSSEPPLPIPVLASPGRRWYPDLSLLRGFVRGPNRRRGRRRLELLHPCPIPRRENLNTAERELEHGHVTEATGTRNWQEPAG